MKIAGIIAEYNPFHNGHAHQISQLHCLGFDAVVCVCSPSVVQRGELALFPAAVRTRAALLGGADVVFSLPAPYALCSAEGFARAGVHLLCALGVCDAVAFGTETPDIAGLEQCAQMLDTPAFSEALHTALENGAPYAAARARAAERCYTGSASLLATPNNALAVEYCRALLAEDDPKPVPLALPREGAPHDAPLCENNYASGSALRALVYTQGIAALAPHTPTRCMAIYAQAAQQGQITSPAAFDLALLSRLRACALLALRRVRGVNEGLEHRLQNAIQQATTAQALYDTMKTKRYAHARLRRLALDAALGYTCALPALPPYLHVLGASTRGLAVLRAAALSARLPLSQSLAQLEKHSPDCAAIARAHAAAEDFAALCLTAAAPMGTAYTTKFIREA